VAGPFVQSNLEGTWRFSILRAGGSAGWMRGSLTADAAGAVSIDFFVDEMRNVLPPPDLFPNLLLDDSGHVRDAAGSPTFTGVLAPTHRNVIVATAASTEGASIAVLLEAILTSFHPPTAESPGDTRVRWQNAGGGSCVAHSQITTGASAGGPPRADGRRHDAGPSA
jgi:hypothetical protein